MDTRRRSPPPPVQPCDPPRNSDAAAPVPHLKNTDSSMSAQSGVKTERGESLRESVRQALFQATSNKALQLPSGYLKVAVLIIRWDESIDDFKEKHTEEIARLEKIFVDAYGYTCKVHSIQNSKKPQLDLNMAILNHIYTHDGPNNLLMFYYTGHGDQSGGNGLELSANQNFMNNSAHHMPAALWNSAEEPIRQHMEGDALSILDCCMASTAGMQKCRNGVPRTYQLLAASAADAPTCAPGRNSFTTALCDSLIELLSEAAGGTFTVTQLSEKINEKRKTQACLLWDRLRSFKRNVQLGRLEQSDDSENAFPNADPEQSSLVLRLSFKTSDLEDDQIKRLGDRLPHACHEANIPLRRIDWIRMTTRERDVRRNVDMGQCTPVEREYHNSGLLPMDDNELLDRQPPNLRNVSRKVMTAQRWLLAVKNIQAEKTMLEQEELPAALSYFFVGALVLKLTILLSTLGLLYFRGEQTGLVLSGVGMAWMLIYGPCKLIPVRNCPRLEANG